MKLAEEMILPLLNEESGYLKQVQGWNLSCVLAGTVLANLALERRIDTALEPLVLADPTPTGDRLLDPVLAEIAADSTVHNHLILSREDRYPFRHRPGTDTGSFGSQQDSQPASWRFLVSFPQRGDQRYISNDRQLAVRDKV